MKKIISIAIIILFVCSPALAGNKHKYLQKQINMLRKQINQLMNQQVIQVHDFNDQFIGHLYGQTPDPIFLPSLKAFVNFEPDGNVRRMHFIYFTEPDCQGDIGAREDVFGESINYSLRRTPGIVDRYVIFEPTQTTVTPLSYYQGEGCRNRTNNAKDLYLGVEIDRSEIPFNLPVQLPLRYKP